MDFFLLLYKRTFCLFSFILLLSPAAQSQATAKLPATEKGFPENIQKENMVDTHSSADEKTVRKESLSNKTSVKSPSNKKSRGAASAAANREAKTASAKGAVYFTDFKADKVGTAPAGWFWRDSACMVVADNQPGHWLSLGRKGTYAPADKLLLPENFRFEFDLLMQSPPEEGLGTLSVSFAEIEEENPAQAWRYPFITADLYVGWNYSTFTVEQKSREEKHQVDHNILRAELGSPVHITIEVKGARYTLWANEQKVVDLPDFIQPGFHYNRLLIATQLSKADNTHQVLVSNFRLKPLLLKAKR